MKSLDTCQVFQTICDDGKKGRSFDSERKHENSRYQVFITQFTAEKIFRFCDFLLGEDFYYSTHYGLDHAQFYVPQKKKTGKILTLMFVNV